MNIITHKITLNLKDPGRNLLYMWFRGNAMPAM